METTPSLRLSGLLKNSERRRAEAQHKRAASSSRTRQRGSGCKTSSRRAAAPRPQWKTEFRSRSRTRPPARATSASVVVVTDESDVTAIIQAPGGPELGFWSDNERQTAGLLSRRSGELPSALERVISAGIECRTHGNRAGNRRRASDETAGDRAGKLYISNNGSSNSCGAPSEELNENSVGAVMFKGRPYIVYDLQHKLMPNKYR